MELIREAREFLALIPEYNVNDDIKKARNKVGNYYILSNKDLQLGTDEIFGFKVQELNGVCISRSQANRFINGELKTPEIELPKQYIEKLEKEEAELKKLLEAELAENIEKEDEATTEDLVDLDDSDNN